MNNNASECFSDLHACGNYLARIGYRELTLSDIGGHPQIRVAHLTPPSAMISRRSLRLNRLFRSKIARRPLKRLFETTIEVTLIGKAHFAGHFSDGQ